MWAGGIIVVATVILSLISGLYAEYFSCVKYEDEQKDIPYGLEGTTTEANIEYLEHVEKRILCNNIESNIYLSYLVLILGIGLLVGGWIRR